ncbi:MAG: Haloalkane dehalogenase [Paracidovorax wautersii]|uniref:Haloalkane dehalogenase n=1 Tax=Paracidovorax wautersii TaxID=1177982 RepID=A0A7V8FL61_9BURK|nr:MAG: Haloalkane dehalogenase [Paracidovorax wautersii]
MNDSTPTPARATTTYTSVDVDGLSIFFRDAGPREAPVIVALHGFPSSSRMYEPMIQRLSDQYRLVVPDLPGFGHSAAPGADAFDYTFDHLARVIVAFIDKLGLQNFALLVQDYGGPVGFRVAQALPERVTALLIQNAVAHEEGLGPLWETRRALWRDRSTHEAALRKNFFSADATRLRHVGKSPHPERYDPDLWTDELAFLARPGQQEIQTNLFHDYQSNVAAYPQWQAWLRQHQPATLVIWGRYAPSFEVAAAHTYQRDVPAAEVHVVDAGHFPLDEAADEIARLTRAFLESHLP